MAVMDFNEFKSSVNEDMIFPALMRADWNEEILKNLPHRDSSDLALYYYVKFNAGIIKVTNAIADVMGWTEDWLYETAVQNVTETARFQTMSGVLKELSGLDLEANEIYVMMNGITEPLGAGAIITLINSGNETIESLRLIPSSIHEWLLIPETMGDESSINAMIRDINENQVEPDEWLSDHVYSFADLSGFANAS